MNRRVITIPQVQNLVEDTEQRLRQELGISGASTTASIGGYGDLQFVTVPVSVRQEKGWAFITVTMTLPAGTAKLKVVFERYTGAGPGAVTVVKRYTDTEKAIPAPTASAGGSYTFELDIPFIYNSTYGSPRIVAVMQDGTTIQNPSPDVSDTTRLFTDFLPNSTFTLGDAFGVPSSPSLGLLRFNRRDTTTLDIGDAEIQTRVWAPLTSGGAAQTWGDAKVDQVVPVISFAGTSPYRLPKTPYTLQGTDLTQVDSASTPVINRGYVDIVTKGLVAGAPYTWDNNIAWVNGEKVVSTGSALAFQAANENNDLTQLTNVLLTARNIEPFDDGRSVQPILELTQPLIPVAMKNFTLRYKKSTVTNFGEGNLVDRDDKVKDDAFHYTPLNGGTIAVTAGSPIAVGASGADFTKLQSGWRIKVGAQTLTIDAITDATHLTFTANSASGAGTPAAYTVVIVIVLASSMKVKPGLTYNLQVTLRCRGGNPLTINGNITIGADGYIATDTGVPTLATNPDTGTTGPSVRERQSNIKCTAVRPSANINTLLQYQFILQSANTVPAGDPTVGSESVLAVLYGQHVVFGVSYEVPLTTILYIRFRAQNQFATNNGWSAWSAATDQNGYSRPLQDMIGDSFPVSSEGFLFFGSNGSGVSASIFQLDSGASAVDDFYNGMAIHFDTPGTPSPNQDTWRTITDYVGSTKRATLDTALSGTPGGGVGHEIHMIGVAGDRATKSRSGHTTTTFVLDAGASNVDDFYNGYTLYISTMGNVNKIRKVSDYTGATRTVTLVAPEIPYTIAPVGDLGYLLVNGSIGYSSPNNAFNFSGIAAPVPFRWYLDSSNKLQFEVIPPTDQNAFSLTNFQLQLRRGNVAMPIRIDSGALAVVSGLGFTANAPTAPLNYAAAVRFRNLFRTASDGWSIYSYFVALPQDTGSGGVPNYDPDIFGDALVVDFQDVPSYPTDRYSNY